MNHNHALNLMWWSLCLMCASVGFVGGVMKSSYDREQERMRADASFNALENRNSDETLTEQQITALIESRAVAAKLMEEK